MEVEYLCLPDLAPQCEAVVSRDTGRHVWWRELDCHYACDAEEVVAFWDLLEYHLVPSEN